MFNFIRDEWLSMIIARKQYVKDSKVKIKAEKKQRSTQLGLEEEEKVPMKSKIGKPNSELGQSQLRFEIEQAKQSQASGFTPGGLPKNMPKGMVAIRSGKDD